MTSREAQRLLEGLTEHPELGFFEPTASFAALETSSGSPVGCVLVGRLGPGVGHIAQLVVAPGHLREGIGTALLVQALDRLCELGCPLTHLAVHQDNPSALALYQGLGFRPTHPFPAVWCLRGSEA